MKSLEKAVAGPGLRCVGVGDPGGIGGPRLALTAGLVDLMSDDGIYQTGRCQSG